MTDAQKRWLDAAADAAFAAKHIFPTMAACEAAEESNFGGSMLARVDNNLFGMKQHQHPAYGTVSLPTREYLDGAWHNVDAMFVRYPNLQSCFEDRMDTLRRLRNVYSNYAVALEAPGPIEYVTAVSRTWSTDPSRASKVIAIYNEWLSPPGMADSLNE